MCGKAHCQGTVVTMTTGMYGPLARYAERFHAVLGDGHHVASPLGAWLLLALCASASSGATRDELAEILGADVTTAAAAAAALLDNPHPLVPSATAVWHRPAADTGGLSGWRATLPRATEIGPLPEQACLDSWARERTLGLIEQFPLRLSPAVLLVLASALATRVSWQEPFEVAPASALGPGSAWATRLTRVLRTPEHGHTSYIAMTKRAGDVIVHVSRAKSGRPGFADAGLFVVSVAAAPDVKAADVLAAAYELSPTANGGTPAGRRSLFHLPLGEAALWTIREEPVLTQASGGREERHLAVLPCWSARNDHDLSPCEIGFPVAARVLATLLAREDLQFEARQAAMARYGRYGFEAAAASGFFAMESAPTEGVARIAELRFGHPYAVVAVAIDSRWDTDRQVVLGPWHGVPVFSAWVSEPEDLPEAEAGDVEEGDDVDERENEPG